MGWCYQFWQAERKVEVNAAGNKIGADELPAVTQLFTEDYMVDFLLDNTLGAWHAGKVLANKPTLADTAQSEEELRNTVALPGCPWKYLRFIQKDGQWTPAAGTFDGWPKTAKELKCLDPCMGSGHFVVAMFERLVALRLNEEKLDETATVAAVIKGNLFGLEIDPRCTQIAAFNLALAAWRRVGHCPLPAMNLACSGLAPNTREADWLMIAGDNDKLKNGMTRLYRLFQDAPVLGSLINPRTTKGDLLAAGFHELQPLLEKALAQETKDDSAHELAVTARGLAKAAEILTGQFTLVATNVPYLAFSKQAEELQAFTKNYVDDAKRDLATVFVQRCLDFSKNGGTSIVIAPQNWLFLGAYTKFRGRLLNSVQWEFVVRLGAKAFQTPMWDFNVMMLALTQNRPSARHQFYCCDADEGRDSNDKASILFDNQLIALLQSSQLKNPDARIGFHESSEKRLLLDYADSYEGIGTGDLPRFSSQWWELPKWSPDWEALRGTTSASNSSSGMEGAIFWQDGKGDMVNLSKELDSRPTRGFRAWGKMGVAINRMGDLSAELYFGEIFECNIAAVIPKNSEHRDAIWHFCKSPDYSLEVRKVDQAIKVTNVTLLKIPFDLEHWQQVAAEKYPHGLPKMFSSDPTQWLFNGHPKGSDQPLHVAVARLLSYQWPRQTGSSFPDCPALGPDGLETLADKDGIVCLSATKGEEPAAERLRGLLVQALGTFDLSALLASSGPKVSKAATLEEWLETEFFEQHCALFHHLPFIWHIWDGHKSGFSALVNYHQLTHANLEKLTYAYLGDWLRRQQAAVDAGEAGSDARLQAAKLLQARLKLILEGEPPFDLFVRWKPLSKQAIGWHPDLNDGVRMNIRPFLAQDIPGGKKGAGLLRTKPNIKWEKDRGKEPVRDKAQFPWFWGWDGEKQDFAGIGKEPDGNRWNNCHYTNEFKKEASEANKKR